MKHASALAKICRCLLVAVLLLGFGSAQADSPIPPKNLKQVGDHWTPWDPPQADSDAYIIVPGDNLWDLAGRWLNDSYLWPQIWDENRYILDSHWIYPGDPLVIPGRPTVVPDTGPPAVIDVPSPPSGAGTTSGLTGRTAPTRMALLAAPADLYCSGYVDPSFEGTELLISGQEMEQTHNGTGHVVYLNRGRDWGVSAGDEYMVIRPTTAVTHPVTGASLGSYIRRLGKVRVMIAHDGSSTAVIESACSDIVAGDRLVRWQDIPFPPRDSMPDFDRYSIEPSGGPTGYLVYTKDKLEIVGEGNVVTVDLGELSGVRPGDVLTLFRENGELPRLNLGQALVLTVEPATATARITVSVREMWVGDQVELVR